jgi:hypothetical protein
MMTVEWLSAASHWMMSRLKWLCLDSPWVWRALAANPLGSHSNSNSGSNWKLVVVVVVHKALVVALGLLSRQSRQLTRMCT